MCEDDLPMVLEWRNHPDVRRFMFTQHEISSDEHLAWFSRTTRDTRRRLLIIENDRLPFGYVQFSQVVEKGISDWGFYTIPDAPKGTGRKLGVMALNYAFGELKLHKVCGQAIDGNNKSIVFHQRLGFMQEGVLRDQFRIDGAYHSLYCFGLLAQEWRPDHLV
jgi:UDP-4-amino-4,6-dideoxy-N-acetyl-beta-L-altrosamine N-acetyltransferase